MRYLTLVFLFCLHNTFSQNVKKNDAKFNFTPSFRINAIVPSHYGENYLAKATKAKVGIGINVNFIQYNNLMFGMGLDYIGYSITDNSKGGNLGRNCFKSIYGDLSYKQKILKKIIFNPYIGMGYTTISASKIRYGRQEGTDFRIGSTIDYTINKHIAPFIGICYLKSKFKVETTPEYSSYFSQSNMLQINIGLKIN